MHALRMFIVKHLTMFGTQIIFQRSQPHHQYGLGFSWYSMLVVSFPMASRTAAPNRKMAAPQAMPYDHEKYHCVMLNRTR